VIQEFTKRNLAITNSINCENPPAIRHMVELGMGGAFFPLFSIQKDVQQGLFHMAEIEEDLSVNYDLIFLRTAGTPRCEDLYGHYQETAAQLLDIAPLSDSGR
jgi:DNA-binding transcriptional LysR family regulator